MAALTINVLGQRPRIVLNVEQTNIDAGNTDAVLSYDQANLDRGFSIITKTITAVDIKVFASNKDGDEVDITQDLFGVLSLASDTPYIADVNLPVKNILIRTTRTAGTNEVNWTAFAPR